MADIVYQKDLLELATLKIELATPFLTISAASKAYLDRTNLRPDPLLIKQTSTTSPYYSKSKKNKKMCVIS